MNNKHLGLIYVFIGLVIGLSILFLLFKLKMITIFVLIILFSASVLLVIREIVKFANYSKHMEE